MKTNENTFPYPTLYYYCTTTWVCLGVLLLTLRSELGLISLFGPISAVTDVERPLSILLLLDTVQYVSNKAAGWNRTNSLSFTFCLNLQFHMVMCKVANSIDWEVICKAYIWQPWSKRHYLHGRWRSQSWKRADDEFYFSDSSRVNVSHVLRSNAANVAISGMRYGSLSINAAIYILVVS